MFAISIDVDALAKPGVEAFSPGCQLLRCVVFETQAGVGEACGEHVGGRLLFGLGQAERCPVLAKNGVRFIGVPRRVTYLKGERESGRAKSKKVFQQRTIELESGGQLDEYRPKVVAIVQYTGHFQEALQSALAAAEPLNVSDLLVDLQGEAKAFGNALRPVQKRRLRGHVIEGVIDFNGRELLGVEAEQLAIRKLLGIKTAFPLFIGVSRSPDTKPARGRNGGTSKPWHLITSTTRGEGKGPHPLCDQGAFFVLACIRLLRSSMACSILWRRFQKSAQRSPFSLIRAKMDLMFRVSGRRLARSSRGKMGVETGALGNARTA